ncbi:hypothetical protein LTS18_004363 [Coniosporium uncinatum]|uniref:Uncharacterized protein n=1 Tax=Coniosporium uncinatum TaxID=93489 RepID=A0ACC3DS94_9PEZI|nr:hypothetical protein LTS18_004363 [Coniosporium uncinatum]
MFDSLKAQLGQDSASVDGLEEYRSALRKNAVQGQAVIEAQKLVREKLDQYYRAHAAMAFQNNRQADIQSMANAIDKEAQTVSQSVLMLPSLRTDLFGLRRRIFLNLHKSVLALVYHGALGAYPVDLFNFDVTQTTTEYTKLLVGDQGTATGLTEALNKVNTTLFGEQIKGKPITIDTTNNAEVLLAGEAEAIPALSGKLQQPDANICFPRRWRSDMLAFHSVSFEIPSTLVDVDDWWHVRVTKMRAYFFTTDDSPVDLPYTITLGPQIADKSSSKKRIQYFLPGDPPCILAVDGKDDQSSQWKTDSTIVPAFFSAGIIGFQDRIVEANGHRVSAPADKALIEKIWKVRLEFSLVAVYKK